jgi:diguanylate cyclase (GGDEF)-like protein/PAS domain S-box-containing protein
VPAEGESRFRAVFETAPHGMVTFDLDLVVIDANASLARMLGEAPPALAGRALASLDCVDAGVLEAAHACVAGCADVIVDREVEVREPAGAGRHYHVAGTLVRGRGDEPRYATLHVLDLTAQRRAEAELERLAWYDRLTALPNRAFFERRLDELRRRVACGGAPFALLLLDLDGFKAVNDRYGHAAGDALLERAGRRLGEPLRAVDMVARLGGDEFAILLADAGIEDGVAVAEVLSDALRRPFDLGDVEVRVAASIGVVSSADGDRSGDAMLRRADLALYRAKREGPGGARRG